MSAFEGWGRVGDPKRCDGTRWRCWRWWLRLEYDAPLRPSQSVECHRLAALYSVRGGPSPDRVWPSPRPAPPLPPRPLPVIKRPVWPGLGQGCWARASDWPSHRPGGRWRPSAVASPAGPSAASPRRPVAANGLPEGGPRAPAAAAPRTKAKVYEGLVRRSSRTS